MQITIDPDSGFCFGVRRAVEQAEKQLAKNGRLYCLGDIVHNKAEMDRLAERGLITIDHDRLRQIRKEPVMFRAHGEPPESYRIAGQNSLLLTDATCLIVKKLQERIQMASDRVRENGGQLVIYGSPDHPEIVGLRGHTGDSVIIVNDPSDLGRINPKRPVELFSQTTKSPEGFRQLAKNIRALMKPHFSGGKLPLNVHNTICGQISRRMPLIRKFASGHEVVIFVGGTKSSNAKVLFNHCREVNPRCRFVSGPEELMAEWFRDVESAGVCGATSTPVWLMEQVADRIRELTVKTSP